MHTYVKVNALLFCTSPLVGMQIIVIGVFVCLSVSLSVCPLAYLKNHTSKFHHPLLTAMRYVMYFRFSE